MKDTEAAFGAYRNEKEAEIEILTEELAKHQRKEVVGNRIVIETSPVRRQESPMKKQGNIASASTRSSKSLGGTAKKPKAVAAAPAQ